MYQNSVCFLIGAFGFIVTVVVTFQKMCTMIGSALDKLGNSQPSKFADLSAPGSPSGVSGFEVIVPQLSGIIKLGNIVNNRNNIENSLPKTTTVNMYFCGLLPAGIWSVNA